MARRKGEKEALRRERERREAEARAAQRRKRLVGYGGGAVLAVVAIAVVVLLAAGGNGAEGQGGGDVFPEGGDVSEQTEFEIEAAAKAARCDLRSERASGVADHTTTLEERVQYDSNPPTDGRHYQVPAQDNVYAEAPTDEQLVHSLEHGRVVMWVKPSLPEAARESIRALYDEDTYQMLLVPRSNMRPALAATAWNRDPDPGGTGQTLSCPEWNDEVADAVRTFRDEHRSNGPEPVP